MVVARPLRRVLPGLLAALVAGADLPDVAVADTPGEPLQLDQVFDQPWVHHQLVDVMNRAVQLGRAGRLDQMEEILQGVARAVPAHPAPIYNLACAKARQGEIEAALDLLERAVDLGLNAQDAIRNDPDLEHLRDRPRFDDILQKAATVAPFSAPRHRPMALPPHQGRALVSETNTAWDPRRRLLLTLFDFNDPPSRDGIAATGSDEAASLVRGWYREGAAAGNYGDLYDNRDEGHSPLRKMAFPLLTHIKYGPEARERKLHWGAQTWFLFNAATLGNASVAATGGVHWRSMARHAYSGSRALDMLYLQYRANHLYVYPEHNDYDPGHNGNGGGYGDLFAVNTPYLLISQGSSFSDQPFLEALALTLAAFRPAVKRSLAAQGLLMPALQMLLRSSQAAEGAAYLEPDRHRVVFDPDRLRPDHMVRAAHRMTEDALPPLARLKVVEEDEARPGVDYFHHSPSEVLCTTPCAIGRVARSMKYERRMVVSAEDSIDAHDRSLTYHWRVLQGDPDRIRVRPTNDAQSVVELRIAYHERFPVKDGGDLESNRVDIGVFVHNGVYYSPPSFVTIFYLDNEQRTYDEQRRIRAVQYSGGITPGNYVDPLIDLPKDWRDEFHYDAGGRLTGWTRTLQDHQAEFDAEGRLVVARDDQGRPTTTRPVFYVPATSPNGTQILTQAVAIPRSEREAARSD